MLDNLKKRQRKSESGTLFKNVDFDFLGKKWWFILPSLALIVAGLRALKLEQLQTMGFRRPHRL
jgi:hypothetical protein